MADSSCNQSQRKRFVLVREQNVLIKFYESLTTNGTVSDKPSRLMRHQRAQAHNSTLYRCQQSFMYWLCSKQNCLMCAYEFDFGDNDKITIVKTGLTTKKYGAVLSVLNLASEFVKCNRAIGFLPLSKCHWIAKAQKWAESP
jgi:hypothetical protein